MRDKPLLRFLLRATPGDQVTPDCLQKALRLLEADGSGGAPDERTLGCRELLTLALGHWQPKNHWLYPGLPHQPPRVNRMVRVMLLIHQHCRCRPLTIGCVPVVLVFSILTFAVKR